MKKINVVSYGAGVNSTALIIFMYNNKIPIDLIIFADTGAEMPRTYKYLKVFDKWLKARGLKITIVKSHLGDIREHHYNKKIFPFRMFRACSDKWKIRPINKYVKENYPGSYINMFLGIDAGESRRVKESRVKIQDLIYPLVTHNIDRRGCIKIIKNADLPIPVKSGCYFCPFQRKTEWFKLLHNHPDLFNLSLELEENGRGFPEFTLGPISLRKMKEMVKAQTRLNDFMKEGEPRNIEGCVFCEL